MLTNKNKNMIIKEVITQIECVIKKFEAPLKLVQRRKKKR